MSLNPNINEDKRSPGSMTKRVFPLMPKDSDFPDSGYAGEKIVVLIENGSATHTWLSSSIEQVLSQEIPLNLAKRWENALAAIPEELDSLFAAFDNNLLGEDARLIEATVDGNEFNLNEWLHQTNDL